MSLAFIINSDNVLEVNGVFDSLDNSYINDATVVATLYDRTNATVSGQSWPLTLGYESGSDGIYKGVLQDTLALTITYPYRLVVTITKDTTVREATEEVYVF